MFGTMGFSELMIILVIVLIIFGAGRLPQIGEAGPLTMAAARTTWTSCA